MVVSHLKASFLEAALDVETFVDLAAVQDGLVAANFSSNVVKSLDKLLAELLPLLILGDGDIFNVTNQTEMVDAKNTED